MNSLSASRGFSQAEKVPSTISNHSPGRWGRFSWNGTPCEILNCPPIHSSVSPPNYRPLDAPFGRCPTRISPEYHLKPKSHLKLPSCQPREFPWVDCELSSKSNRICQDHHSEAQVSKEDDLRSILD